MSVRSMHGRWRRRSGVNVQDPGNLPEVHQAESTPPDGLLQQHYHHRQAPMTIRKAGGGAESVPDHHPEGKSLVSSVAPAAVAKAPQAEVTLNLHAPGTGSTTTSH